MGYRIEYDGMEKRESRGSFDYFWFQWLVAVFLVVFFVGVSHYWEAGREKICQALLPQDAVTAAAVEHFAQELKAGEDLKDAVVTFCREIIYETEN